MSNSYSGSSPGLSEADLLAIEAEIGVDLPEEMRAFYMQTNGGKPENTAWEDDSNGPYTINTIFPFRPAEPDEDFPATGAVQDVIEELRPGGQIPDSYIPFADDWDGNYFCVDTDTGEVFFVSVDEDEDEHVRLDTSFEHFLDNLEPEDED